MRANPPDFEWDPSLRKQEEIAWQNWGHIRMSCWHLVTILSKLGCFTYLGDLQPTYIGVIIYLLSSMDIPVGIIGWNQTS